MVLNRTNTALLRDIFGDECQTWIGHRVVVYNDANVMFAGKKVGGLRLRAAEARDLRGKVRVSTANGARPDPNI
jgi:hypothetical protein